MSPDLEQSLLVTLGELIAKVDDMQNVQVEMNGKLSGGEKRFTQLEVGLAEIKGELQQVVTQQKIANGRTNKLEKLLEQIAKRVGLLEQWRRTVNFLPRMVDRIAEHKVLGLVVSVPLTVLLTLGAQQLLT